jgi:hypothetical protein
MIIHAKLNKDADAEIDAELEGRFPGPSPVGVRINGENCGMWGGGDLIDALQALLNMHPGYRLERVE